MFFRVLALSLLCMPLVGKALLKPNHIINRYVPRYMKEHRVPGMAVGIYYKGKPYFYNFGLAIPQQKKAVTEDTIFEIGSITKCFTTTLLALEIQKGDMHLADRVGQYISPLKKCPLGNVTLEQLAIHTSSLPRKLPIPKIFMTKKRVVDAMIDWHPKYPIGSKYLYSNLAYNILGYALEEETDKSYMRLYNEYILKPLNMNTTMLNVPPSLRKRYAQPYNVRGIPIPRMQNNALGAAGSLKSTARDMMNFLMANLGVVGPQSLIDAMRFTQKGRFKVSGKMTQGLSWQQMNYDDCELIDKNGGVTGFSTWMGFILDDDEPVGLFLLSNKRNPPLTGLGRRILRKIYSLA